MYCYSSFNSISKNGLRNVVHARKPCVQVFAQRSFYKEHALYKYDNRNVIYVAYVGLINEEHVYKYGKSAKLFQREFTAHRHNFDMFDMKHVYITDNKDVVEEIFEKELLIRNIHRTHVINSKKQTELFATNDEYTLEYIHKLLKRIIRDNPSYEVAVLKKKLARLEQQLKSK
jgi:hypothetical protein